MSLPSWKQYVYRLIAAEISAVTRYYDRVVQWRRQKGDTGFLLESIDAPRKDHVEELTVDLRGEHELRTAILLNGALNYDFDIVRLLRTLRTAMSRTSRVVAVLYNPYYGALYRLARRLGVKAGDDPTTFVTFAALRNLAHLAGFEIVRARPAVYFPFPLLGLGSLLNRLLPLVPLVRHLGLVSCVVLRPVIPDDRRPTLTVLVPARNERDNIAPLLRRIPDLGTEVEVLFVEGHSNDGTWEEIERVVALPAAPRVTCRALRQPGIGKSDAVRLGFSEARSELVVILDADLSVPPELLSDVYDAWRAGLGDFINGSRLVYPMEGEAMRPLNRIGNAFFAKALTFVLDAPVTDSLCGTKLAARHDLQRMRRWREDFGDFDPFGDFELLFPAAVLALGIMDLPIRYRARTYGSTNIHRFRDGLRLLRMTFIGLTRLKSGKGVR